MKNQFVLKDERADCYSVMKVVPVENYLDTVKKVYKNRQGGLEGQRDTLKTSTAVRIRKRMIEDLKKGTVLPPVVIGMVVSDDEFENFDPSSFDTLPDSISEDNISIIDGMQRTSALFDVQDDADLSDREMRVEYWIARSTNSLVYRMLILNTGQVPWNLRRQIEVVFRTMIREIDAEIPDMEVWEADDKKRRKAPGQFQANEIIELFLVFGSRKEKIDVKERLADEFTRLDFIEATSERKFTQTFYGFLKLLVRFDKMFGNYECEDKEEGVKKRFRSGKDLFASQPARVGFAAAVAVHVFGRPGLYREDREERWKAIRENAENLLDLLQEGNSADIGDFLDFTTLNEAISRSSGKVGDFERKFFSEAFKVLIEEEFDIDDMRPCWRAY
ncbi:hypothetical protein QUF72_08905 [Desulfobacterales bacterium HSG2]|nr:hypothetical protein [Desulfobacterales bacterium HSG2]